MHRRNASAFADRIRILGLRRDLPELLAAADVFAFPSAWEGLGGWVIEAMALGLPVVASDIPALREVVTKNETGPLPPIGNPGAFAAALISPAPRPGACAALGASGRKHFLDRFTIQRSAERMRDLYAGLLPASAQN